MKKYIFILSIFSFVLTFYIYTLFSYNDNKIILNEDYKKIINTNTISMMYETVAGSGEYQMSNNISWPQEGYIFNERLSGCENGGTLTWNDETKRVIMESNTSDKCYVYFDVYVEKSRPFYEEIATWSISNITPNISQITNDGEYGIYKANDDLGTSYYFRGDVENNYVLFAGYFWRIIRINGDGTVRIIYDGTSAHANGESNTDRQIGTSSFNDNHRDNAFVGYMYGKENANSYTEAHTNTNDSVIKTLVDNWYKENIEDKGYSLYISDAIYCNDRELDSDYQGSGSYTGYGSYATDYMGVNRLTTNKSPLLTCAQENDRFSVGENLKNINTNGDLTYPVGLITADEIALAGGVYNVENDSFYLNTGNYYWTMTARCSVGLITSSFGIGNSGKIGGLALTNSNGVRPVISLKSDVEITGSGTMTDPYVVK